MRTAFIEQLILEARRNERIFLIVGDLGFNVVEPFANEFPDRFLNVGICEQNMAGIAGGLAMNDWIVYMYSIGNFPTLRCIEQIRNDIVYYGSNVRIISVGAGFAYGSQGVSHQATEDVAMMRSLPNLIVCCPSDPVEARMLVAQSVSYQGPMYIRLGKAGEKTIHSTEIDNYKLGTLLPIIINKENRSVVLSSGAITSRVIDSIYGKELPYDVYTIPVIKPISTDQICEIAGHYNQILIIEENQKAGGVGSAIVELLSDAYNDNRLESFPKIKRLAINDEFLPVAGSQSYLQEKAGLLL